MNTCAEILAKKVNENSLSIFLKKLLAVTRSGYRDLCFVKNDGNNNGVITSVNIFDRLERMHLDKPPKDLLGIIKNYFSGEKKIDSAGYFVIVIFVRDKSILFLSDEPAPSLSFDQNTVCVSGFKNKEEVTQFISLMRES